MNSQLMGYVGLSFIIFSYTTLLISNKPKLFYGLNSMGALFFFFQAVTIKESSLMLLHGFTGSVLFYQLFRKNPPYICHRDDCDRRLEEK